MLAQAAVLLLCLLWGLLCLRFYVLISKENVGQRRIVAIAAGLGAGLLYVIGTYIAALLGPQGEGTQPPPVEQEVREAGEIRLKLR